MARWTYVCLLIPLLCSATWAQSRKLNLPLPLRNGIGSGSVADFELAPDDSRVVYLAREASDARAELYGRPLDGSQTSVRLTGTISATERVLHDFQISPDGKRVYFLTVQVEEYEYGSGDHYRLYGSPSDGSSAPKRLAEMSSAPRFSISPEGAWIVYLLVIVDEYPYRTELFSVPADGHREPIRLSSDADHLFVNFRMTRERAVFVTGPNEIAREALVSIGLDGTDRVVLNGTPIAGRTVSGFALSPDGSRVVYTSDQTTFRVNELFSTPISGGGTPVRLNGTLVQNGDVRDFQVSPDSSRVLYRADQERSSVAELYVAPIDGASSAVKVSGNLAGFGVTAGARFNADSMRIVFRSDGMNPGVFQLFSGPADASAPPVLVSGASVTDGDVVDYYYQSRPHLFLGADDTVVYLADSEVNGRRELYSAPLEGGAAPTKLSGELVAFGDVLDFEPSAGGSHVLFRADKEVDQQCDLFAVPVTGGAALKMTRLSLPPDLGFTFRLSADGGHLLYRAAETTPGFSELYRRPTDASTPAVVVNGTLSSSGAQGNVHSFQEHPESGRVLYAADQFVYDRDALMSVRTDGAPEHVQLSEPLERGGNGISTYRLIHGRAIFVQPDGLDQTLLSVPVDRALEPVELGPPLARPFFSQPMLFSPDGTRVLFSAGEFLGGPLELYSAPVDGGEPTVKLNGTLVQNGQVQEFQLVPDGSRVLYMADAERFLVTELFSVAMDGSAPPVKLSGTLVEGGEVADEYSPQPALVTPDSRLVLYRADALVDERIELFAAPPDGSVAPVKISGDLQPNGDVQPSFKLALGDRHVVYRADALVDERFELFHVPLDGSAAHARIEIGLEQRGDVLDFVISPDGARVLLRADTDGDALAELYTALFTRDPVRRLDAPAEQASVIRPLIDPTGRRVVYSSESSRADEIELFSVLLDGSAAPIRLGHALHPDSSVAFELSSDGQKVAYVADPDENDVYELLCAPIDGSQPPRRVNDPLLPGREVWRFGFSADGRRAFYIADQEEDNVFELFQVFLELPSRSPPRVR